MTVADDLATLRHAIGRGAMGINEEPWETEAIGALARAEAEITRLTEERDAANRAVDKAKEFMAQEALRAEAAEAEIARLNKCLTLETERAVALERLEFVLRSEIVDFKARAETGAIWLDRAHRAEAEVARLRDGLRRIASRWTENDGEWRSFEEASVDYAVNELAGMARALLAEDGAATAADGGPKWTLVWDEFEDGAAFPVVNDEQLEAMGLPTDDEIGGAA